MKNVDLQPLAGFRDQRGYAREWLIDPLKKIFKSFGYEALDTPALEKQEVLLSNYGEEAQKLLYLFKDNGGRDIGLRYDLTLPLARFVSANFNELVFPYKRYEIGKAWRAEKPQKGRFREFYQADVDILGTESPEAEVELFEIVKEFADVAGLKLKCLINDRRLTNEILEKVGADSTKSNKILQIIDKKEKISREDLAKELAEQGLDQAQTDELFEIIEGQKIDSEVIKSLTYLKTKLEAMGFETVIDPSLVRGLDYYTGTVFEFVSEEYSSTLIAGGRYDKLVESFIGQKLPSVGISFGIDRILDLMGETLDKKLNNETIFIVKPENELDGFSDWIKSLRDKGKIVDLYLDKNKDLGAQLKYANKKGYKEVIIPLEEEWEQGNVILKNMESGEQLPKEKNSF